MTAIQSKDNSVVAVIVTHNRIDKLKVAFSRIVEQDVEAVIVVNNASTDGSKEWLLSNGHRKLHIVNSPKNIGGAGGFWLGFKTAISHYPVANWILCFDDDAYPNEDLISWFRNEVWEDNVGGVGSAVYLPNGNIAEMNRPFNNPFRSLGTILKSLISGRDGYHLGIDQYKRGVNIPVDAMSFVGAFIRVSLVKGKLGLPRKEFFIYADDTIYTLKIRKLGYQNIFCPMLHFTHDCETVIKGPKIYTPVWKVYYTLRNGVQLFRELAGPYYFLPLTFKMTQLLRATWRYNDKNKFLRYVFWGLSDGIKRNFDVPHEKIVTFEK